MGITTGFCTLKAQFIIPDFPFESAHFDSVQRRWDFMAEDSQAKTKALNNGLIKFWRYPFVLNVSIKLQRIIAHIAVEVYGFKSFAKLLRLGYVFFKKESFKSFKRRSWTRNFNHCGPTLDFFFLPWFRSTKQAAEAFFLAYHLIKSGRELSIHSIITVIHFSRAIKL